MVDHKKIQHTKSGNGQFNCVSGKCSAKPNIFKNQRQLDMHRTCHENVKCDECGKEFDAKRNLKRHKIGGLVTGYAQIGWSEWG